MTRSSIDALVHDELLDLLTQLDSDAPPAAPASSALDLPIEPYHTQPIDAMSDSPGADPLTLDAAPFCISDDERAMLLAILSDSDDSDTRGDASSCTTPTQAIALSTSSSSSHSSESESVRPSAQRDSDANVSVAKRTAARRPSGTAQQQSKPRRIRKPRPNRKRRKHEVDALRIRVAELTELLRRLQLPSHARVETSSSPASRQRLLPASQALEDAPAPAAKAPASASLWQTISAFERDEARAAVTENARLRALYACQVDVLQRLDAMYRSQFDLTALGFAPPPPSLTQQLRLDPFDDDFALFASLGRTFAAQFAAIESDLLAVGFLHFDGERAPRLVPKRAALDSQTLYLESSHSRVLRHDLHVMEQAIVATNQSPVMYQIHKLYEVRSATETISFLKVVDDMALPTGTATLTTRIAIKRFPGPHRMVGVWDAVIDVSGGVSMRMREQGWNALRPPLVRSSSSSSGQDGAAGPCTIEQSVVRYFPIDASVETEQDMCAGSLHYVLVTSYRRHLEVMHQITDSILRSQALE